MLPPAMNGERRRSYLQQTPGGLLAIGYLVGILALTTLAFGSLYAYCDERYTGSGASTCGALDDGGYHLLIIGPLGCVLAALFIASWLRKPLILHLTFALAATVLLVVTLTGVIASGS
jgi:hypothetical protein